MRNEAGRWPSARARRALRREAPSEGGAGRGRRCRAGRFRHGPLREDPRETAQGAGEGPAGEEGAGLGGGAGRCGGSGGVRR